MLDKRRRTYGGARAVMRGGGFGVGLDETPLKTPAGAELVVASITLAEAIAEEWQAQGAVIEPASMPFTRLANSAIDRVARAREATVAVIAAFADSDLVCFRVDVPPELLLAQEEAFAPLLAWVLERFGAELKIASGVMPAAQPQDAIAKLAAAVAALDDLKLAGLQAATTGCGSLILALALAEGRIGAEQALAMSEIDEAFQAGRWGVDPAYAARREAVRRDIAWAARFMELCRA